jgi:hypothetical protein
MNSYLAKLMFNIKIGEQNQTSNFDEQIRLLNSTDFANAFLKARNMGKQEEELFLNTENLPVKWEFIDVIEIYPLENVKDGEALFSITHENENAEAFINYIRHKSMMIQTKCLTFA